MPSTAALCAAPFAAQAQAPITIYCSILEEQCRVGVAAFEKATGAKATMVRKSTGETLAQIRAEASNPRADIWWGGPGDSHIQAAEEGLTVEYKSPKLPELHDWAQRFAEQSGYRATGTYLGALGIGYNTKVLQSRGLPEPKCWADLLDPKYRDEVQVSDPNSSGTAYVFLASLVQLMGEDKAFDYMKSLHKNVNQYTKSGAAPVKAVALGETGDRHRVHARHGDDDRRRRARENPRALRGHRLRDGLDLHREGRQEHRNGAEVRGLGPLGRRAEARRRGPEDLLDRVQQERARLSRCAEARPR